MRNGGSPSGDDGKREARHRPRRLSLSALHTREVSVDAAVTGPASPQLQRQRQQQQVPREGRQPDARASQPFQGSTQAQQPPHSPHLLPRTQQQQHHQQQAQQQQSQQQQQRRRHSLLVGATAGRQHTAPSSSSIPCAATATGSSSDTTPPHCLPASDGFSEMATMPPRASRPPRPPSTSPPAVRRRPGTAPMMQLVTSPPPPPSSPHGGTAAPPSTTSTPASSAVASPAMIRSQRPAPLLLASTSAQSVGAPWSPPPTNSPMSPPTHSVQTGASTFATSSFFGGPPPSTAHASSAFSHGHSSNGSPRGRRGSRGMDARMAMVGQSSFRTHQQSPTIGLASPSTSPFSPATTMPIVRFPHSTLGPMASGGGSTRPGPVSPGSVSLIAVPSLTQSTRTSFQPVQDPRGPSRTQAAGTTPPKRHGSSQRRDQRQHHRSASWCGGDEEDSFAKTPFRFTPTRDCSISPRSTPSPSSIDPYMRGLSPRQPSASPSRGVSRTARASPRAPTPPRFRGDRCDRLRNEVREMLLQSELDNLTAEHVRTLMMDDGTVVPIEAPVKDAAADAEKRADGCFPGDAKVLAKRQTPRTPAVFSPVSCANTA